MTDPVTNYCQAILGENETAREAIRYIPEFAECSDTLLDFIYRYSKPVNLQPDELLIKQGEFDQWVYFIVKGELDVVINEEKLGVSKGPVVGERCILGEPRGADLVSGSTGLLALGVEMSIVDEIHREINNFRKETEDVDAVNTFIEDRMAVVLELLTIVLRDVVRRLTKIYQSVLSSINQLDQSKSDINIQAKNLYDFSEPSDATDTAPVSSDPVKRFTLFSLKDFSETVYYEILQKHMSDFGFEIFPVEDWLKNFIDEQSQDVEIETTFEWMKTTFQLSNEKLVDIANSIFEVASQYTGAGNRSINLVLSEFENEDERQKAVDDDDSSDSSEREQMAVFIEQDLFNPVKEALESNRGESAEVSSKMNQLDIDALFD